MSQKFDIGQVLAKSFSTLSANLGAFLLLTAMIFSPMVLYAVYMSNTITLDAEGLAYFAIHAWIQRGFELFLGPLATAAVTYGVFRSLRGQPASFSECLRA